MQHTRRTMYSMVHHRLMIWRRSTLPYVRHLSSIKPFSKDSERIFDVSEHETATHLAKSLYVLYNHSSRPPALDTNWLHILARLKLQLSKESSFRVSSLLVRALVVPIDMVITSDNVLGLTHSPIPLVNEKNVSLPDLLQTLSINEPKWWPLTALNVIKHMNAVVLKITSDNGRQIELKKAIRDVFVPHIMKCIGNSVTLSKLNKVTPLAMADNVAKLDTVHPIKTLRQLLLRTTNRRHCYYLTFYALPDVPVAAVHLCVNVGLPRSIKEIFQVERSQRYANLLGNTLVLYSIGVHETFHGMHLGELLLRKLLVTSNECPNHSICTMSPVPDFRLWLSEEVRNADVDRHLKLIDIAVPSTRDSEDIDTMIENAMSSNESVTKPFSENILSLRESSSVKVNENGGSFDIKKLERFAFLKELLEHDNFYNKQLSVDLEQTVCSIFERLCVTYLRTVKQNADDPLSQPRCAVARFHLNNGAQLFAVQASCSTDVFDVNAHYLYRIGNGQLAPFRAEYLRTRVVSLGIPAKSSLRTSD